MLSLFVVGDQLMNISRFLGAFPFDSSMKKKPLFLFMSTAFFSFIFLYSQLNVRCTFLKLMFPHEEGRPCFTAVEFTFLIVEVRDLLFFFSLPIVLAHNNFLSTRRLLRLFHHLRASESLLPECVDCRLNAAPHLVSYALTAYVVYTFSDHLPTLSQFIFPSFYVLNSLGPLSTLLALVRSHLHTLKTHLESSPLSSSDSSPWAFFHLEEATSIIISTYNLNLLLTLFNFIFIVGNCIYFFLLYLHYNFPFSILLDQIVELAPWLWVIFNIANLATSTKQKASEVRRLMHRGVLMSNPQRDPQLQEVFYEVLKGSRNIELTVNGVDMGHSLITTIIGTSITLGLIIQEKYILTL